MESLFRFHLLETGLAFCAAFLLQSGLFHFTEELFLLPYTHRILRLAVWSYFHEVLHAGHACFYLIHALSHLFYIYNLGVGLLAYILSQV